jgi:hypothetical protein
MPNTMTLISSSTVGSGGTSTISFNSIPQTYTDLKIFYSARSNKTSAAYANLTIRFNGDSGSNYGFKMVYGTGSNVYSAETIPDTGVQWAYITTDGATANTFGNGFWYIPNYTSSNPKSVNGDSVSEHNETGTSIASMRSGRWTGTAAITSISIVVSGTIDLTIKENSTFYLYGIKNS